MERKKTIRQNNRIKTDLSGLRPSKRLIRDVMHDGELGVMKEAEQEFQGFASQGPYYVDGQFCEKQIVLAFDKETRTPGIACFLTGPVPEGIPECRFEAYENPFLERPVLRLTVGLNIRPSEPMLNRAFHRKPPPKAQKQATDAPSSIETSEPDYHGITAIEDIPQLLGDSFAIFTGAGISMAAGISDLTTLHNELEMDFSAKDGRDGLLTRLIESPDSLLEIANGFLGNFYFGTPTRAHLAVRDIQRTFGVAVITENEDQLHQHCETDTLTRRNWDKVKQVLKSTDVLLVLGIGSYRSAVPYLDIFRKGDSDRKVIAVSKKAPTPSYLRHEDYFFQADLEEMVPELRDLLISRCESLHNKRVNADQ